MSEISPKPTQADGFVFDESLFCYDCTGDACAGDVVLFTEAVFDGYGKRPKFLGERRIVAKILKDSYGAEKQQHTFTLEIVFSDGFEPLNPGTKTTRKGRNLYRKQTWRMKWENESQRQEILSEKHKRGDAARSARDYRRQQYEPDAIFF